MFTTNPTPNDQIFSRLPCTSSTCIHSREAMAKAWGLICVGGGCSVPAAGLVAAHRQHCGVDVPANASGGCQGFPAVYLLWFFCARVCVGLLVSQQWQLSEIALTSFRWWIRPFKLCSLPKQSAMKVCQIVSKADFFLVICSNCCSSRSLEFSPDAQRCAHVVFRLKWSHRQIFCKRMGELVERNFQGAFLYLHV